MNYINITSETIKEYLEKYTKISNTYNFVLGYVEKYENRVHKQLIMGKKYSSYTISTEIEVIVTEDTIIIRPHNKEDKFRFLAETEFGNAHNIVPSGHLYNDIVVDIDLSKCITLNCAFEHLNANSIDVSNLDTSHIESMHGTFQYCQLNKIIFGGKFNTSKVRDMSRLFYNAMIAGDLDLSSFDTSMVKRMVETFKKCRVISLNVSSWNTRNVESMFSMFQGFDSSILDLHNFRTKKTIDMRSMFYLINVYQLNVSSFEFAKDTRIDNIFDSANLQDLDLSSWDTSMIQSFNGVFRCCRIRNGLNLEGFRTDNAINMNDMFYNFKGKSLNLKSFITIHVKSMQRTFAKCELEYLDLSNFKNDSLLDMDEMFSYAVIDEINLVGFTTPIVASMVETFMQFETDSDFDISTITTEYVKNFESTFSGIRVRELDITHFSFRNCKRIDCMFAGAFIKHLGLPNSADNEITSANYTFKQTDIEVVDLTIIDFSKLKSAVGMFLENNSKSIKIGKFSADADCDCIFNFCKTKPETNNPKLLDAYESRIEYTLVFDNTDIITASGWKSADQ